MPTVVQISDTHLSHRRSYAVPNVTAVVEWIRSDPPDLVVHTGDITADDPDDLEEAAFARDLLLDLPVAMVAIPGNHDVGGFSGDRFTPERLDAYRSLWGADTWALELAGWWLVGANVFRLLEEEHDAWLDSALAVDRPTVLFLHQPMCLVEPGTPDEGDWSLAMAPRRRLLELIEDRPVTVVASGHLHRYKAGRLMGGTATVWAPAASFLAGERPDGCTYRIGAVTHRLGDDGVARHELVEPPGVRPLRFHDLVPPGSHGLRDAPTLPLESER